MDAVLTAALGAVPQLGGAGLLFAFLVVLIRREGAELTRVRAAHETELARIQKTHDDELQEKQVEINELRERRLALEQHLDLEREKRRAAEDAARLPRTAPASPDEGRSPWAS